MEEMIANQLDDSGMSDEMLDACGARLELLPLDEAVWVAQVLIECRRARAAEAELRGAVDGASSAALEVVAEDVAQVVLDAGEWLKTLWNIGYMGAGNFPTAPRSEFPVIEIEDVLKSALLQRIRSGRRPLPFPPPTRQGMPWHEVVESDECFVVDASLIRDEDDVVIGASIEGCTDWVACNSAREDLPLVVQHQGKGPLYKLTVDPFLCQLQRLPPQWTRRIVVEERAGYRSYFLEWPSEQNKPLRRISLRATNWERADAEAQYWVATHFPGMYGQVCFERSGEAD